MKRAQHWKRVAPYFAMYVFLGVAVGILVIAFP